MAIGLIDIGGTSIKFGRWANETLETLDSIETPADWPGLLAAFDAQVATFKALGALTGIGISSAGVVDVNTGVITGAGAADYAHDMPLIKLLGDRYGVPVAIENDANCAALGEAAHGAARGIDDVVLLVIGTGVGGAVIINGQIHHGVHLLGGEFGYMLNDDQQIVSQAGTAVNMAAAYSRATGTTGIDGKTLFARAAAGDAVAAKYVAQMCHTLAKTIFNLQYSIDPTCFVLGGGVSSNPALLPQVQAALQQVFDTVGIAPVMPDVRLAQFRNAANLIGAAVNWQQHYLH